MTNQEAIEMLTAKAECIRREASGIDVDCNHRNCDECDLCYKHGTMGDQMEALGVAISALQEQDSRRICNTCKHDPPSKKWPCEDCDMRESADRWEPKEAKPLTDLTEWILTQKRLDTISRWDAIDALMEIMDRPHHADFLYTDEICKTLNGLPRVQPEPSEITDEQAILHLQSTGWMQRHDKEMYESGLREQLADDSGSYDSLIPCEEAISRTAAIDIFDDYNVSVENGELEAYSRDRKRLCDLPSAQPEIIHCQDCIHAIEDALCGGYWCKGKAVTSDHYCGYAERRTDELGDS